MKSTTEPAALTPPKDIMIGGISLVDGLRWYLEKYLEMPVEGNRKRAENIQNALRKWGCSCFDTLFGGGHGRDWYRDARREGLANLRLEIVSDDPAVLSWPWEALESPDDDQIALSCHIERHMDNIGDPPKITVPDSDQLNVLYIIPRPFGDGDVGIRTLARPMIDFIKKEGWPVRIDVLRPPTFNALRNCLKINMTCCDKLFDNLTYSIIPISMKSIVGNID